MLDRKGAVLRIKPKVRHKVPANFAGRGWAFLLWQAAIFILQAGIMAHDVRRAMPER